MIEIVHYTTVRGVKKIIVFNAHESPFAFTPVGREYVQRYAAGLEKPAYALPAIPYSYSVSRMGRWAIIKHRFTIRVYRWWHKVDEEIYHTGDEL